MDPQLAFLMANQAKVVPGSLVLDPFVGSGKLMMIQGKTKKQGKNNNPFFFILNRIFAGFSCSLGCLRFRHRYKLFDVTRKDKADSKIRSRKSIFFYHILFPNLMSPFSI